MWKKRTKKIGKKNKVKRWKRLKKKGGREESENVEEEKSKRRRGRKKYLRKIQN